MKRALISGALLIAFISKAELPSDAPVAQKMSDGSVLLNPSAAKAIDDELKRLQGVERQHKAEEWVPVILLSVGVGILVGAAAVGVPVALAGLKPGS